METTTPIETNQAPKMPERTLVLRERFHYPIALFPKDVASDIQALDTFVTYCFRLIDLSPTSTDAKRKLTECKRDIEARTSRHQEISDFNRVRKNHSLPDEYIALFFEGLSEEISTRQFPSHFDYLRYCYKVSSIPILMVFHIFEAPEASLPFAIDLGIALELTRMAQEIGADAAKDKFYLAEELVRPDKLILGLKKDPVWELAILRMQRQQFESADRYLESAVGGISLLTPDGWIPFLYLARTCRLAGERTLNLPTNYLLIPYRISLLDKLKAFMYARSQKKVFAALGERECAHDSELHIALSGLPGAHQY
ncbi:MAG: squalene/phytoene synthase family protein [Bdellovibrionales bacterium]|nr:squalene/phytoene synthase family protein [Bdellovibrionales bacterium]